MASTLYCAKCLNTFSDDAESCPNLACGAHRPKKGWGLLLGAGDLLDRNYQIIKPLAVGGAGLTYLAREVDSQGNTVPPDLAIKVLYTQRDAGPFLKRLSTEAQILQDLDHENIVQCRGFVQRTGHAPYLVTLFEQGGSLSAHVEHLGGLKPKIAAGILRQILLALDVAHQRGVVHRDLKPENVLLAEPVGPDEVPHVRVADFGIAKVFGGVGQRLTRLGSFIGTPEYAAPEQFEGMAPTPATDVFAAGGLLYFLMTAQPPVKFTHRMDIENSFEELLNQLPPRLPIHDDPTEVAILQDVLDHTMKREPGDRFTIHQVLARLNALDGMQMGYRTVEITDPGADERAAAPPPPPPTAPPPTPSVPPVADVAPPPPPPPKAEPAPAGRRGAVAGMVGLAGGAVVLGGIAFVGVLALGGAAWQFGWLNRASGAVVNSGPVAVAVPDAVDITNASDPALAAERDAITRTVRDQGRARVVQSCRPGGPVDLDVVVGGDGRLAHATVTSGGTAASQACVAQALAGLQILNAGNTPVKVHMQLAMRDRGN